MWTEKYRPIYFLEIKGQDEAVNKVKDFVTNFKLKKRSPKKAMILYGPPGTGKTTLALVAASETFSEVFELNASDLRDKAKLEAVLKPAIEQKSFVKKGKIILIDEADGIFGTDRGGIPELIELIDLTKYPIIITANDVWQQKLSPLRKKCEMVELKSLNYKTIKDVLTDILKKEKRSIDNNLITNISVKAKGDLRAAINDLYSVSKLENPSDIEIAERNKEIDIFNAMKKIFKLKASDDNLFLFDSINMSLDEIMLWIEKNIPAEYQGAELARAYDLLSKADIFKGRIYKQQYWRFLVYQNIFLSYGIASVKNENRMGFTSYKKPSRILKIWMINQKTIKKKSIAEKYAKLSHMSMKKTLKDFAIIQQIINSDIKIADELKLDEEEIAFLKG